MLAWMLLIVPFTDPAPERVDVIERNHFGLFGDQIILWDSCGLEWECVDWAWTDMPDHCRSVGEPRIVGGQWQLKWHNGVTVVSDCYIVTATREDREIQAAQYRGTDRRKLTPLRKVNK